jgi:hypothetical protein
MLQKLWVIHTTANVNNAASNFRFTLEVQTPTQRFSQDFPDLPHDERNRGRTDQYEFDLRDEEIDYRDVTPGNIRITSRAEDAWLPESIWVIGQEDDGEFHLLVGRPEWPSNAWFGTRPRNVAAQPTRPLDQR